MASRRFASLLLVTAALSCGSDDPAPPPPAVSVFGLCKPPARNADATVALAPAFDDQRFQAPVEMVFGPGRRFYVLEQAGVIKAVPAGGGAATVVADLKSTIRSGGEAGLLGIAFDPKFSENGLVYLSFNADIVPPRQGVAFESVVARARSTDGGATIDGGTLERVLVVEQPFSNHNGGKIGFGPDGHLYIALGDGGSGGDPLGSGQDKNSLLGKILRIDVSKTPYAIPADNPFAGGGGRPEIFAYGLRNPWKFAWDPVTSEMWAADVGQGSYEEIDRIVKGGNYGWSVREGKHCFKNATCPTEGFVDPVLEYGRSDGVSVTGGYVYRGATLPSLDGKYVYGDFGSGRIWAVDRDESGAPVATKLADSALKISTFGQDDAGEVYVADYGSGTIKRIVPAGAAAPASGGLLSETGCLDSAKAIPYTVASQLWSDGADKERWLFLGEGKIGVAADGDFDIPPGSVAVKTFALAGKRIETRLLARYADGSWGGFSYEWNDAQTDATLLSGGKTKPVGDRTWTFPSRGECFACHTPQAGFSLGLEARQVDLAAFAPHLATPVAADAFPKLAGADTPGASVEARARGVLHANCAMCHREGTGLGAGTMDLRAERSLADLRVCNAAPQGGDLGIANAKLVVPGDPMRSILARRMRSRADGAMPPLATRLVDESGVAAVEAWITSLAACP